MNIMSISHIAVSGYGTYADNKALLANAHTSAESLHHSLEQAAGGIGFYVNANKTE